MTFPCGKNKNLKNCLLFDELQNFQCRFTCLAKIGLPVIFLKVQKAWNVKTADCLRTYLPGVSAVKWKAFLKFKKSFGH